MSSDNNSIEFSVFSKHLFKAIAPLSGLVSGDHVVPILSSFLFHISAKSLQITGSDRDTTVITQLPIEATGTYKIAVPASILIETLRNLPEQPLKIKVNTNNYNLTIQTSNGRYRIACESHLDFPKIQKQEKKTSLSLDIQAFKRAIKQTLFVASKDRMHPNICGVNIALNKEEQIFVTTDGHRLVRFSLHEKLTDSAKPVTLPSKSLQLITQLLPDSAGRMDIVMDEKRVYFWAGDLHIYCTIVDEPFPNYEGVIPQSSRYQLTIQTQALRNAMRIIDFYTSKLTHEVSLSLEENKMLVRAEDREYYNQGEINLSCIYEGEPMTIGVNARLFFDVVKNIEADEIILHLQEPQKAIVMRPSAPKEEESLLLLVMPVALKSAI